MNKKGLWIRLILGGLFFLFAIVQINDPDPFLWTSIYGIIGLLSVISIKINVYKWIYYFCLIVLFIYSCILIPEIISWISKGMPSIVEKMKAEEPHIEYTREFFGLVISLAAIIYLMRNNKLKN